MERVALWGIGSPVVAEVEESCARRGWHIVAACRNHPGAVWTCPAIPLLDAERMAGSPPAPVLVPLFSPANRQRAWKQADAAGAEAAPALTDPTAILPRVMEIGIWSYVNAGAMIGAAACLGRFVFVSQTASIGHHCELADFASVGPGAVVLPGIRIGAGVAVPAGAVVRRDIPAAVVGTPESTA
ncbi:MAG: acetyltransferase [Proteobacteria bacterium]|nr:acetyltransferase [Pseudomonadota bacterium]